MVCVDPGVVVGRGDHHRRILAQARHVDARVIVARGGLATSLQTLPAPADQLHFRFAELPAGQPPARLRVDGVDSWLIDRTGIPVFDPTQFIRIYVTLAAQRASKILGIFARLDMRDGKPQYLRHMPRVWGYLQRSLSHPELEALSAWYAAHVPSLGSI